VTFYRLDGEKGFWDYSAYMSKGIADSSAVEQLRQRGLEPEKIYGNGTPEV
jgi:hypothetical protein